jgi:hypothetical protein
MAVRKVFSVIPHYDAQYILTSACQLLVNYEVRTLRYLTIPVALRPYIWGNVGRLRRACVECDRQGIQLFTASHA